MTAPAPLTRNPWVAIMHAVFNGRGLHLSADEVFALSMDNAIETCAMNDVISVCGSDALPEWKDADPRKFVGPANGRMSDDNDEE